ncbi:MAG TPA: transposase [Terriglobales bacterium]|nr:transposase [Terriglobales bacterium]
MGTANVNSKPPLLFGCRYPGLRTFFVTSSTCGKRPLLQSSRSAELLIEVLYHYRSQNKYRLHSFIVMPDHFHTLITVGAELSIERAVQFIKGGFAYRAGKELNMRSPVWQKGFSEVRILDAESYGRHREYIHENPVVRHLAVRAEDYPYSSANGTFEVDPPPQGLEPHSG